MIPLCGGGGGHSSTQVLVLIGWLVEKLWPIEWSNGKVVGYSPP